MKLFSLKIGVFDVFLFVSLLFIFYFFTFKIETDIPSHAQFIVSYTQNNDAFPVNFLHYFLVYVFSFFSTDYNILLIVSVYLLAFYVFARYLVVKFIVSDWLKSNSNRNFALLTSTVSLCLLFVFSLPSVLYFKYGFYYIGNFPPNVWHNSTTILAMPFVLLLFYVSFKQLVDYKKERLVIITVLIALNAFAKPSFLFVFLLVYPLMVFVEHRFSKLFWLKTLPIAFAVILVLAEYLLIFISKVATDKSNSIEINFFQYINLHFSHGDVFLTLGIFVCGVLSSVLFPLVFILRNKKVMKDKMMQYVLLLYAVALVISQTFAETGSRYSHGNFIWQAVMCSLLLFLVSALHLLRFVFTDKVPWSRFRVEIIVFSLHLASAVGYAVKILSSNNYY